MKKLLSAGFAVILLCITAIASADNTYWVGTTGDWSSPSNWMYKVPDTGDSAYVGNGGTAQITSDAVTSSVYVEGGSMVQILGTSSLTANVSLTNGNFEQTGSALSNITLYGVSQGSSYSLSNGNVSTNMMFIQDSTFTQSGGILTDVADNWWDKNVISSVFNHSGGTFNTGNYFWSYGSSYYLSGTGQLNSTGHQLFEYGQFNQSGGSNTAGSQFITTMTQSGGSNIVGGGQTIETTMNQTGGSNEIAGSQSIWGTMNQSGGSNIVGGGQNIVTAMNQTGGYNEVSGTLYLGYSNGTSGTYSMSAASLSADGLQVGYYGNGNFQIDDSLADISIANSLFFGGDSSLSAVSGSKINMNGASLDNWNADQYDFWGFNNVNMVFNGGTGVSTLEVAGQDVGFVWSGSGNFAFDTLTIGDTSAADVQLVNNRTNMGGTEALYANNCILEAGSTLDLNGINLYCNNITDNGATIYYNGGQLIQATVIPEPISSALFITGGILLAGRRYIRSRNKQVHR